MSESPRKGYAKHLRGLGRKTDLNDPLETESYILDLKCTNKYKNNLLTAYWHFCKANQITWQKPKSLKTAIFPVKIPTEERINVIIACATPKYALVYNLSKYGLRPDEVSKITLRDLDLERGEVNVRTSKLGLERTLHLKNEVRDLIRDHINRYKITNLNQRLFSSANKICEPRWSIISSFIFSPGSSGDVAVGRGMNIQAAACGEILLRIFASSL